MEIKSNSSRYFILTMAVLNVFAMCFAESLTAKTKDLLALNRITQEQIEGKILDENSVPLPGVTIKVQNQKIASQTNLNGQFKINAKIGDVLLISFIGFEQQSVRVVSKNIGNIILKQSLKTLDEVVVVGYGTVQKSDLTGSVSKFSSKDIEQAPVLSIDQALQGKVSGVQIVQSSGSPGAGLSFIVRGGNSLGSNRPLIVLDGYPIDSESGNLGLGANNDVAAQPNFNPLANLNPNDVESIEILKDASSTAIYGSRGANGVILITTKNGKKGSDIIDFNYKTDISTIRKTLDVLNTADFISYANESALNDGLDSVFTAAQTAGLSGVDNNWQDQIYRTSVSNTYQLSVSGGDEKNKYFISGNYLNNEGIVVNSNFNRGSLRLNYDRKVSNALNVKFNVTASKSNGKLGLNSGRTGLVSGNVISSALYFRPIDRGYNENGDIDQETVDNPATIVYLQRDETENTLLSSNLVADLKLTKDLLFKVNFGANSNNGLRQSYSPRGTFLGNQSQGYAYRAENSRFNYLSEFTLNYKKAFKRSNLSTVVGYTWQQWEVKGFGTSATGFVNDNLSFENFGAGNSPGVPSSLHQQWKLASFLGRANYAIDGKYIFTLTGRADGSSKLAHGNKWAFFPSAAFAWNLHQEKFFKDNLDFIKTFKIRTSYGLSGNQNIGVGGTRTQLGTDTYVVGGNIIKGYTNGNIANPILGWETTKQFNVGADIGLLNNRLQLDVNYYQKRTEDLLINLPIPSSTGYSNFFANAGTIANKGLELELTGKVLNKSLKWNVSGNISFNRNKMVNIGQLNAVFGPNYLNAGSLLNQPLHIAVVGQPVGSFYGYRINGIYQNAAEVAAGPQATTAKSGDFKFVDLNNDNSITAEDREIIGNPAPDYIFGLTNNFNYKKFSFSFFVQGSIGNDIINLNRYRLDGLNRTTSNVSQEAYDNRWTGEGTSNYYPRANASSSYFNGRFADFIVEDGSYIRLKNVNLSYELPKSSGIKWFKGARIFITATNLITITDYSGYDPEVNADFDSGLTQGVDNGTYPQFRTISTGVNFKF